MKKFFWGSALLLIVMGVSSAREAEASSAGDSAEVFLMDTITFAGAREADALRRAESSQADSGNVAGEFQAGDDTSASALPGTPAGLGSISGKVVSEARGTAVPDVRVIVAGQNLSANTDADGRFGFPGLPPGTYSLFLYHASYAPLTADSLRVAAGKDATRRLALPDKAVQGEAVRITGSATQASDAGMLFARKNSPAVSDGISAEQISKSPDADAAAALKRVTGISIAGDGLVYVRGLGERYVNMQLNGMTVSSPNPEKRVVPLDMFPTRLLDNLNVSKTFTADQPAEFAGGSLQLRTKDYPEKRLLEFSASAGYEPGTTFEPYLTYKGGKLDWLGTDDGTRAIPSIVPKEYFDESSENLGATDEERRARQKEILAALPNIWTPYPKKAPVNQSYGLTLGNKVPFGEGQIFGWLIGAGYSTKVGFDEEFLGRIRTEGADSVVYRDKFTNQVSTESVQWGVLGTTTWQPSTDHKIRANFLFNRDWEDEVTRVLGQQESESDTSLIYEIATAQQTLRNGQLEGEHKLTDNGLKLTWVGSMTGAARLEPDRRTSKYFVMRPEDPPNPSYNPDFPYFVAATQGLQDRYWFTLQERGWGGKTDLEAPFEWGWFQEGSKARTGLFLFTKSRDYRVRHLSYQPGSALSSLQPGNTYEEYFGALNGSVDSGYITNKQEKEKDNYSVEDFQWAAHAQADWTLSDSWRAIAGARLMTAKVEGRAESDNGALSPSERAEAECSGSRCVFSFGYDKTALLPAASLVYAITDAQNVRAAWTRTFSFPEYREMAPLLFFSYQNGEEVVGNVKLKPTDIYNYDLRWEWFPTAKELMAISGFYKRFQDPVELRISNGGTNNRATFVNVSSADLWGAESELRVGGARFHDALSAFEVSTNFTWIHSEVKGERKRTMQGQSPYLVNAILFFEPFDGATQMSLLYNRFGRRLSRVGVGTFPDVFEESRESLEYSYTQKFAQGFKTKFTVKNLTDAEIVQTQGGLVTRRVKPGISLSLGATYAF